MMEDTTMADTTREVDAVPGRATTTTRRVVFVAASALIIASFLGAYGFAASRPSDGVACDEAPLAGETGGCSGGCCGSGEAGPVVSGEAVVEDGVQRISVDVSQGYFDPGEIVVQAGIPTQITFSEGQGCLAEVMFEDLGIQEDLTRGGAVVELPALEPGTYGFSCGMRMVFGTLVVR